MTKFNQSDSQPAGCQLARLTSAQANQLPDRKVADFANGGQEWFVGCEQLEVRQLLTGAAMMGPPSIDPTTDASEVIFATIDLDRTRSRVMGPTSPFAGQARPASEGIGSVSQDNGASLIGLDRVRADPRFSWLTGSGFSSAIIDTGINASHPFFGPDANSDGVADRIVYQYDFADGDNDASDFAFAHGSNVASVMGGGGGTYQGVAPGANIVALKVFREVNGQAQATMASVESALRWVINNYQQYKIVSVNLSIGDGTNRSQRVADQFIGDELAILSNLGVTVVASAGNSFSEYGGAQGLAYPAADPNVLAVGAVYGNAGGAYQYGGGSIANSIRAGAITPFSQRSTLMDIFAPGAPMLGASLGTSTVTMHGTSQAAPVISGIVVLMQQMSQRLLGRQMLFGEIRQIITSSATTIIDGDDEDDNVNNTAQSYRLVNVASIADRIYRMATGQAEPDPTPVARPNWVPSLTAMNSFDGAVEGRRTVITYEMLANASNPFDQDNDEVSFIVQSVTNGRLSIDGSLVRPGETIVRPGDVLTWVSSAGASGNTQAFRLVAFDGRDRSQVPVSVNINVQQAEQYPNGVPDSLVMIGDRPAMPSPQSTLAGQNIQTSSPVATVNVRHQEPRIDVSANMFMTRSTIDTIVRSGVRETPTATQWPSRIDAASLGSEMLMASAQIALPELLPKLAA